MLVRVQSQAHLGFGIICCCENAFMHSGCGRQLGVWQAFWEAVLYFVSPAWFSECRTAIYILSCFANKQKLISFTFGLMFQVIISQSNIQQNKHGMYDCNDYLIESGCNLVYTGAILCSFPDDGFLCVLDCRMWRGTWTNPLNFL